MARMISMMGGKLTTPASPHPSSPSSTSSALTEPPPHLYPPVSMCLDDYKKLCQFLDTSKHQEALELVKRALGKPSRRQLNVYLDGYFSASGEQQSSFVLSPLVLALRGKSMSVFQYLLTRCPPVIVNKLLSIQATYTDTQLLSCPIYDRPNPPTVYYMYCLDAETLLHLACRLGLVTAIQALLRSGANTEIHGCRIGTPLHIAAEHGKVKAIELLLDAGANIEACDVEWNTPLHAAVAWDHVHAVECLLDRGADITAISVFGEDAFSIAARRGAKRVLPFLCDNYASQFFSHRAPGIATLSPPPPPLFLLAVGNITQFRKLVDHPECPPDLRVDAKLVGVLCRWYSSDAVRKYKRVLSDKCTMQQPSVAASASCSPWYGDHREVASVEEWEELQPGETTFFMQRCIVLERCIGPDHPVLFNHLNWFVNEQARKALDFNPDTYRRLRLRALEMFVKREELKFEHLSNAPFNVYQFLQDMKETSKFEPHAEVTRLILRGFEVFIKVCERHTTCNLFKFTPTRCTDPSVKMIDAILIYLHNWINECNLQQFQTLNTDEAYDALEELKKIVAHFVHLSHSVLKRRSVFHSKWLENVSREGKSKDSCLFLLTLLLESEAGSLINMSHPSSCVRPLHYIQKMLWKEGVAVLLSHGAHLDVAGRIHPTIFPGKVRAFRQVMDGTSASDSQLTSPLPLLCLCSHVIVEGKIPFNRLNLPSRIKDYVALHKAE